MPAVMICGRSASEERASGAGFADVGGDGALVPVAGTLAGAGAGTAGGGRATDGRGVAAGCGLGAGAGLGLRASRAACSALPSRPNACSTRSAGDARTVAAASARPRSASSIGPLAASLRPEMAASERCTAADSGKSASPLSSAVSAAAAAEDDEPVSAPFLCTGRTNVGGRPAAMYVADVWLVPSLPLDVAEGARPASSAVSLAASVPLNAPAPVPVLLLTRPEGGGLRLVLDDAEAPPGRDNSMAGGGGAERTTSGGCSASIFPTCVYCAS